MVVNQKVTGTASTMPVGIVLGLLGSLGITFSGAALSGLLIWKEVLSEDAIGYCAMLFILISSVAGTSVSVARIKRRRVFVCAIAGGVYFASLLSLTALFFGGQYQGVGVTALLIMAGSTLVALLGLRQKRTQKYHKRKRATR